MWTFTAAQERDLVEYLHREQCPLAILMTPLLPLGHAIALNATVLGAGAVWLRRATS